MGALETADDVLVRMHGKRAYFDTVTLIYALEGTPGFSVRALPFLKASKERQIGGITGIAALTEILVQPLRSGDTSYAEQLKAVFMSGDSFECVNHSNEMFLAAAGIRAKENLKSIDALHLATALSLGCQFLVTNDASFRSTPTLEVILLSQLREE